tara:strand:+ start:83 stop:238 length:156 start_codon:yes stop_codon:yes gene_type:complete
MIEQFVKKVEEATYAPIEKKLNVLQTIDVCKLSNEDNDRLLKITGYWIDFE